jgi:hypothetical protein
MTYQNWQSPEPSSGNGTIESRPVPVMADCQYGYCTIWKINSNGLTKRTLLEMGTITGNGSASSSNGKLPVLVLTTCCALHIILLHGRCKRAKENKALLYYYSK